MRRDSSRLSWRGPRPGPIASTMTEHRRSPATSWPEWSPPSAMARGGCRWDSGCSASRTGIATAPWRSMWPSRHATSRRCRATSTSRRGRARRCRGWGALPMPGLAAWQGLFDHGRLQAGQSVLVHGAAGSVGSMVTQLAREFGAYVIGTGRAVDRQKTLDFGAMEFVDLENDALEDVGGVDLVFDVIGGDIQRRSAGVIRAGGTLVTIAGPPEARPVGGLGIGFVVAPDRAQLSEIVQRVRDGRLRANIGNVASLDDAVAAFNPAERISGQTIIRVRP